MNRGTAALITPPFCFVRPGQLLRGEDKSTHPAKHQAANYKAQSDEHCSRAIHNLNTLQLQCPVFYDGAGILRAQCRGYYLAYEGERTYIDDKEREELIDHYRRVVEQCKEKYR